MKAGFSKTIITPRPGVELAGFGSRIRRNNGVFSDLFLTTAVLDNNGKKTVVIAADIIGFDRGFVLKLKGRLKQEFGFSEDEVLFNASHTHSGPQTLYNMSPTLGGIDSLYIEFLEEAVILSVNGALKNMEEVDVYLGKTSCDFGVNRRLIVNGKADFAPNEEGVRDKEVVVYRFVSNGVTKGVLFNYTCHPSTIDTYYVCADWPGEAKRIIEEGCNGKAVAIFLQGCCGNIRVRTIKNGRFKRGEYEDVQKFGQELGNAVLKLLSGDMEKVEFNIKTRLASFNLPLARIPEKKELEEVLQDKGSNIHFKTWAKKLLKDYDSLKPEVPYTIQEIKLGGDMIITALDGEVCMEYCMNIKKMHKGSTVIVAGYSNGVVGYIPAEDMFDQGGYEPDSSTTYYFLPSQFDRSVEKNILERYKILTSSY